MNTSPINESLLEEMETEAKQNYVPILSREGGQFLRWLTLLKKPRRLLEIGTAIGYSTYWLGQGLPADGSIVTIEKDEKRLARARYYLGQANLLDRVTLLPGDAGDLLNQLEGPFDFVFLDGPKGQYPRYLEQIEKITQPGALLVADNLYLSGLAVGDRKPIRYTTMARRLKEYRQIITESPHWESQLLSVGDGFALSLRKS
ncbi:O-methyltransferase [Heliorestis acidaminivorans]|uniref:tRNA 5-hydroxyuridine methyltransferase n=1 Tax=Heliorestis acidaminivorans TaxID=553427 RepID=A0A6I0EPZ1_9FIRM|nr:O-methyltransferase [Heliorestis acidaminivorans]KAB2952077.1 O-methyltransferase [Heliorestis acidaminivorans]